MSNPIKYAVEPMFDFEKDSNEVLGYIVSKCLVMKSYIDYEEDGIRYHEVAFPFADHKDICDYKYDAFEKCLKTKVANIYGNYEDAKTECDILNHKLCGREISKLDYTDEAIDEIIAYGDALEIRLDYFQKIEDTVLYDTSYLQLEKDKKTRKKGDR